mgnify:CR=1 FL=1
MNNIELNTALLNMGYRYMGVQKDKTHVWGKPIGYTILAAYVTPNMEDVKLSSLCRIYEKSGEEVTGTYASIKYSEYDKDDPIVNATYNDFVEFIKYAEFNAHIENAICSSVGSQIDFSFRNNSDYESQRFVKY